MPPRIKVMPFKVLAKYFHLPIRQVMNHLNVSAPTLKKMCRHYNIERWPHRKLQSIDRSLTRLSAATPASEAERSKQHSKINKLMLKRTAILQGQGLAAASGSKRRASFSDDSDSCDYSPMTMSDSEPSQASPTISPAPFRFTTLSVPVPAPVSSSGPYFSFAAAPPAPAKQPESAVIERDCLLALSSLSAASQKLAAAASAARGEAPVTTGPSSAGERPSYPLPSLASATLPSLSGYFGPQCGAPQLAPLRLPPILPHSAYGRPTHLDSTPSMLMQILNYPLPHQQLHS